MPRETHSRRQRRERSDVPRSWYMTVFLVRDTYPHFHQMLDTLKYVHGFPSPPNERNNSGTVEPWALPTVVVVITDKHMCRINTRRGIHQQIPPPIDDLIRGAGSKGHQVIKRDQLAHIDVMRDKKVRAYDLSRNGRSNCQSVPRSVEWKVECYNTAKTEIPGRGYVTIRAQEPEGGRMSSKARRWISS